MNELTVQPWPWAFRAWRLAVCRRGDVPSYGPDVRFCIADIRGTWVHLFWRVFWLRERRSA